MSTIVLGGGIGGCSASLQLGSGVRLAQRGHRLGGKGASHRGVGDRVEEHGLHVWLGYYDNAFQMMREVYEDLDRQATDPKSPITTIDGAFFASGNVGVFDRFGGQWEPWVAEFGQNAQVPGQTAPATTLRDLVERGATLLADLTTSLARSTPSAATSPPKITLSATPPDTRQAPGSRDRLHELAGLVRRLEMATLIGAVQVQNMASRMPQRTGRLLPDVAVEALEALRVELHHRIHRNREALRLWQAVDLVSTSLIGIFTDRLLDAENGYRSINHLDFREWLAKHGADPVTLDGALIRGMYDLVFAYREGDHGRPAFEAGTGLQLAGRFFFDYKGSLFWKMRAGMGETVFAPLYQSLRKQAVDFLFFHRLVDLRLDDAGKKVDSIELARQVELRPGLAHYEPLVDIGGLPCFPEWPIAEQLAHPLEQNDLEVHGSVGPNEQRVELRRGRDFDDVVLAVSLGMIPHTCSELLEADPRWRAMVEHVGTTATQALQVWTTGDEAAMGWPYPGSTVAGYSSPFDTYASMPHLLEHERWADGGPGAVSYFCSALDERQCGPEAHDFVADNAEQFLTTRSAPLWPHLQDKNGGLRSDAVKATYIRANTDPSDRYVQSLPGSSQYRLAADESGFDNLYLAGDWVDTGLNAGCIEAAVIAGRQAANAQRGRSIEDGILGGWTPTRAKPQTGPDGG